jgi:hypothetical protein
MKTIAATALILTLTASAFAAEPDQPRPRDAENAYAPIVLSAAQLDGVTAGAQINQITAYIDGSNVYGDTNEPGLAGVTVYLDSNRNGE